MIRRRQFLKISAAAALMHAPAWPVRAADEPVQVPEDHRDVVRRRHRRIVVQQDVLWVMLKYAKLHPDGNAPFAPFRDAVFSYVDEPGSQIDAVWWDIGGNATGAVYPSEVSPVVAPPLVLQWASEGVSWVEELVRDTRRRKLEVFWNHRISEVDLAPEGGHARQPDPLKTKHPDWVVRASWWPHGMWNLASEGLREHKVAILREIATRFELDGIQIDFARHVPCLPVGQQWELRHHVTHFMRMVRTMLLEVAQQKGRPILLAAKVPRNLEGCHVDGFDVSEWARQRLVDVLTLGSRSMDVDIEGFRAVVGDTIQLQPCFDDHHTTDGYRYAPIEYVRGVFANHWQRGANSVVAFNWAVGTPEVAASIGGEIAPLTHQTAFHEIGDPRTLAGKDKAFALDRRGGYPWADGSFNRNDTMPLPATLTNAQPEFRAPLHISDAPDSGTGRLTMRCILYGAREEDRFECRLNGSELALTVRDPLWKDAQIFSPAPQPASGGTGAYRVNPKQQLLRLDFTVPAAGWRRGVNLVEVRLASPQSETDPNAIQIEKIEALLHYL